ncbi:MAG TPA: hypothetical protein VGR91_00210 [Stellaceae bacterium]|nr:hypothetical protein [Stellaceae bacterium]
MTEHDEEGGGALGAWLCFWLQFLVLAVVAGFGFAFAAADRGPGDYDVGLGLALASAALGFIRLKLALDGDARGWSELLLVDDMPSLAVAVPLFTLLGLAGLLLAHAWKSGSLYVTGIALFAASALLIFLDIKRVFDRIDAEHR